MKKSLLLAVFCLLGINMSQAQENITVGGSTRNMIVYAPQNLPDNAPLVISLHGANQDAAYQRGQTNWNNCADTAKFVVVYPNAINKFWDTGCARGTGDLLFIETIISEMHKRYNVNLSRVYISGFSLGAMMTYHCMEHLSDKVAACAPVSGVRFDNKAPKASRQVPFIHTHGTGDDVFKWEGDPGHMAGGYPYIPDYVQKWATYYKCTEKTVIKPYPKTKANSNATLTRWQQKGSDFEVALLQLEGKGHWHSEDLAGGVSTTQEIWKFMKRYSLGPEPPKVLSVQPENNSFDMLSDTHRTFTVTLGSVADPSYAAAQLVSGSKKIALSLAETANSKTLTFNVPDGVNVPDGEWTLDVTGIMSPGGCFGATTDCHYIYGVTPVQDELKIDTLLAPNWPSMQAELGQCIPWGWKLDYYDSNGNTTTTKQGTANIASGCRLMYFPDGGDFKAGFYLSARDNAKTLLSYGRYSAYRLYLPKGRYDLSFRSTYWSTGSQSASASFDVFLHPLSSTAKNVFEAAGITTAGTQEEKQDKAPKGCAEHKYLLEVTSASNYSLDFTMSQGWNSVLVADVTIATGLSIPEQYKGTLHRLVLAAAAICDGNDDARLSALRDALDLYRDFASISPSEYMEAIACVRAAFDSLPVGVAVAPPAQVGSEVRYYTIDGRSIAAPQRGVTIERSAHGVKKVLRM